MYQVSRLTYLDGASYHYGSGVIPWAGSPSHTNFINNSLYRYGHPLHTPAPHVLDVLVSS